MGRDRLLQVATYASLLVAGAVIGVYGAFLVPLRLFGGLEGLADLVGVVGVLAAGVAGAVGSGRAVAAVLPGIGWIIAVVLLGTSSGGDVVIPGSLGSDPGIGIVGTIYLASGLAGTLGAGLLAGPLLRRSAHPRS